MIKVGYFDKTLKYSMDLDLWLRLLKIGGSVDIGCQPIAGYREWVGTKTLNGDARLFIERKKMLLKHGVRKTDWAILNINFGIAKCFVKSIPVLGDLAIFLMKLVKSIFRRTFLKSNLCQYNLKLSEFIGPYTRKYLRHLSQNSCAP